MAATLDDLFKYKEAVEIKNPRTGKVAKRIWVRILGDEDMKEAFRFARIVSAETRAKLRDRNSNEYKDEIESTLSEWPRESLEELILSYRENTFANEAPTIVTREDLPELEEISVNPDAPSLEEQERLDKAIDEQNEAYKKSIEEYVQTKIAETKVELSKLDDKEVLEIASREYANIESLRVFAEELGIQQGFRGSYTDEACKNRAFSDIESFRNSHTSVKHQIIEAYRAIEMDTEDIKN